MKRILLVEDDKTIVIGLTYTLKQEGYEVSSCHTASDAREAIKKTAFDLCLLDLSLPDGSGYDLCRLLKAQSGAPVIFLTACDEEVNVVMGLEMGADDYITKPFRVRELLSRIKTVLRRCAGDGGSRDELRLHDIVINTRQAKVSKGGRDIPLTALEYRLLLTLAAHPNQLLSRSQLLEGIWDIAGDFVTDNTLSVYVKRLREKIEEDPQNPMIIKTVRGLGYRVEDGYENVP